MENNKYLKYWPTIMIVIFAFTLSIIWNLYQSKIVEFDTLKRQLNIIEEIKVTEERLAEVKARELQYIQLMKNQEALISSLNILDKKQKQLERKRKEVLINEIEKLNQDNIRDAFSQLGISSTIVE